MIVVNLDGLAYALSTWKYEGERDGLNMHQWRNSLVLWANPLGTLIRIKCLSHLFSVADRNNESLNIVFQRNPSPSWPKDTVRMFTLSLIRHKRITPDQILKKTPTRGEREWTKISQIKYGVRRLISSQVFTLFFFRLFLYRTTSSCFFKRIVPACCFMRRSMTFEAYFLFLFFLYGTDSHTVPA